MLNVSKEIKEYDLIDLEQDIVNSHSELQEVMGSFTKVFERLGKEQYKFSQQLEEIFSMLENDEEQQNGDYRGVRKENEKREQETEGLLRVLLELADSLEDIYRYALRSDQDAWKKQLSLQWQKVGDRMERYGIRRIEGAGGSFDSRLHAAREVKEYPGVSDGQILDILKSGYMLEETILRKAEVVVNRFKE